MLRCAAADARRLASSRRRMSVFSQFRYPTTRAARLITAILALVLFVLLAIGTISGYLLYQILSPPRSPANVDVNLLMGHPTVYKFTVPGDGTREGWFFPGLTRAPTIVLCHGYGSQRADILTLVTALQEHQFNVYLFDFAGHGSVPGHTTLGYEETQEVLAAIHALGERQDIDRTRFGIWGTDMGGYAALAAATENPRISAVAIDSVYDQPSNLLLREVSHTGLGALPLVKTFCLFGFRMINYSYRNVPPLSARLARLQGIPKLFVESSDRPSLDADTLHLFQISPGPKTDFIDALTYSQMSDEDRRAYEDRIVTFFLQFLPPGGPPAQ